MSEPRVRTATPEDARFLAWVMQEADRMGSEVGALDLIFDVGEERRLEFLARVAVSELDSTGHYSRFLVAELAGQPAAALSGYVPDDLASEDVPLLLRSVAAELGWSEPEVNRLVERAARFTSSTFFRVQLPGGTLRVEWVATRPEFRGRGLNRALLETLFERGRASGLRTAHVGTSIGNHPAIAAYQSAGLVPYAEVRHRDYEAMFGRPGHIYFRRDL
jgi:ribosomal protein S18 acetylase RimI-like enzyme